MLMDFIVASSMNETAPTAGALKDAGRVQGAISDCTTLVNCRRQQGFLSTEHRGSGADTLTKMTAFIRFSPLFRQCAGDDPNVPGFIAGEPCILRKLLQMAGCSLAPLRCGQIAHTRLVQ